MTAVAEQTGAWLAEFTGLPAVAPWAQALREAAFERFAKLGFPTTREEEWRFTNVAPIARASFKRRLAAGQVTGLSGGAQAGTLEEGVNAIEAMPDFAFGGEGAAATDGIPPLG